MFSLSFSFSLTPLSAFSPVPSRYLFLTHSQISTNPRSDFRCSQHPSWTSGSIWLIHHLRRRLRESKLEWSESISFNCSLCLVSQYLSVYSSGFSLQDSAGLVAFCLKRLIYLFYFLKHRKRRTVGAQPDYMLGAVFDHAFAAVFQLWREKWLQKTNFSVGNNIMQVSASCGSVNRHC